MNTPKGIPPDLAPLSPWAPELARAFVSLASDIALVLDEQGVIREVAQGGVAPLAPGAHQWVGRPFSETVTDDTRSKIEQLLDEVTTTGLARRREINHPAGDRGQVAVAYTAIRLGRDGPLLAVGRDMGAIAAIQQRFMEAQQEMERGYWRARQAEARYRLLFQVATDAVLLLDADTLHILDANQAACSLFDMPQAELIGRVASFGFERHSRLAVDELFISARTTGRPAEIRVRLLGRVAATSVAVTPFHADGSLRLLMRLRNLDMPGSAAGLNANLARLVDSASDGVVVTDSAGRVLMANPAFLRLARMSTELEVKGRPLMDWIGLSDEQFGALLAEVRQQGIARRVSSRMLGADAQITPVELGAALLTEGDQECIGFTVHPMPAAPEPAHGALDELNLAIERLTRQVGDEPLPELLRHAAAVLERHFIRVALERAEDDAGAAARLLGVEVGRLATARGAADPDTSAGRT